MLVSFDEMKAKIDMAKLKEALPKLNWKERWNNDGIEASCSFNSKHGKGDSDDAAFLSYPTWVHANCRISSEKVFSIKYFFWFESKEAGSAYWRYLNPEDGVIPFYAPGTRSAAELDRQNLKNLLETLHDL